jgi:hypothetical protein
MHGTAVGTTFRMKKPEGKSQLGAPRRRLGGNIKTDLIQI